MSNQIKVLVVGDYLFSLYEEALVKAFRRLGLQVEEFKVCNYLDYTTFLSRKITNLQLNWLIGPIIHKANKDLERKLDEGKYDFVFFYRPRIFKPSVIEQGAHKSILMCYNNDDPFGKLYTSRYWKYYIEGLPYYHHIFYYRHKNKKDYEALNIVGNTSLLRSYYIADQNFPIPTPKEYDVIFIGHFEDDGRDEYIKYLLENGVSFKLFGTGWHKSKYFNYFESVMGKIRPVRKEYNETINKAKIALVFLSTLNSDTYTRRCFEIPATKTLMLAKYTDDLNSMFQEGVEADYFRDKEELLDKVRYYLANEEQCRKVGELGYARLIKDGHEITDRARDIIEIYKKIDESRKNHYH